MNLSICMIAKNEEQVLARCLESVRPLAAEIVLVDTGSTDGTKEIARRFGCAVYDFPWTDDFAAARNVSFERATGDLLMWLDADDVVPSEMLPAFFRLLRRIQRENADMVLCKYVSGGMTYYRERIMRRTLGVRWQGRVHECIAPTGRVIRDDFAINHLPTGTPHTQRNLRIYRKWQAEEALSPRDLFYFGRELCNAGLFSEGKEVLTAMLRGEGWYVNKIDACKALARCHIALGEREEAVLALLRATLYGEPRASLLCMLGNLLEEDLRTREAAFWYESALRCRDHTAEGDIEEQACRDLIPLLALVRCYGALGEEGAALAYHMRTEARSPDHPLVRRNRAHFVEIGLLPER